MIFVNPETLRDEPNRVAPTSSLCVLTSSFCSLSSLMIPSL